MEQIQRGRGRPAAIIDWKEVDDLLEVGCTGAAIARHFGVDPKTFYSRCEQEKGVLYSEYSQERKSKGENLLRKHQYEKAIGKTDKGDNALLIWLGKVMLKQTDKIIIVDGTDRESEEAIDDADGKSKELVDDHIQD